MAWKFLVSPLTPPPQSQGADFKKNFITLYYTFQKTATSKTSVMYGLPIFINILCGSKLISDPGD